MKLIVLGSGTAIPAKPRGYPGLYVQAADEHLVLDAGPGTLKRLCDIGITYQHLDRVLLTHFHPDHCLDLVSILFAMHIYRASPDDPVAIRASRAHGTPVGHPPSVGTRPRSPHAAIRTKPLAIYGPHGLKRFYHRINQLYPGMIDPRTYTVHLKELGKAALKLPGYALTAKLMKHSATAIGYRLEADGRALAYSGDTDYCRGIVELGRGADLLILECSMPDAQKVKGHLTPSECGRIAQEAGCRRLLLTHFYPVFAGVDIIGAVRRQFSGEVILAEDGLELMV